MKFQEISVSDVLKIRKLEITELEQAFPVIRQLRTHLSLGEYIALAKEMKSDGYQIVCLFEHDTVVSYIGFIKLKNLYYGEHIWVYDLVTEKAKQGRGYGKLLLSSIEK